METHQRNISCLRSFRVVDMPKDADSPFNVDKEKLKQLTKNKDEDILRELGGVDGIILSLKTHASYGIHGDAADLRNRIEFFESNSYRIRGLVTRCLPDRLDRFKDLISFLFLCACCVYLIIVGIMLYGKNNGWEDGAFSLIFSLLCSNLSEKIERVVGDYFVKATKGSQLVIVLRNGLKRQIRVSSILFGDVALLSKGGEVPADGLLLEAYGDRSLKVDESHLTDEGKIVEINYSDPFLSSGAKVVEGQAKMMVTSIVLGNNFGHSYKNTKLGAEVRYLVKLLEIMKWVLAVSSLLISLSRYFFGIAKDDNGHRLFNLGITSALEVSYMIVEYIVATGVIFAAMDTSNFFCALKICLAHAINTMAACNVVVRNLPSWEKIGLGGATINILDVFNASNQLISSDFLFVPQMTENKIASAQISSNVLHLIQQGIVLNTTGISNLTQRECKLKFSGSPSERAFLSQASLESDTDWEKLTNDIAIVKVETMENKGRVILAKKYGYFLEHRRGPAEMILAMCSGYYDDMGTLHSLSEDVRSLLKQRLQSMISDGRTRVIALAYRLFPDQEMKDDFHLEENENCCTLLGFVVLKEVYQDDVVQDIVQKCQNAGIDFNIFHGGNLESGVAWAAASEPGEMGTNQGLENEISTPGTTSGEDDITECEGGNGSEVAIENCTEPALSKNFSSAKQCDALQEVEQNSQKVDPENGTDTTELEMNQVSDDRTLEQGTLAGEHNIIQSEVEGNESKEDMECSKEEVSVSGSDDGIVLEQINDNADLSAVEDEVTTLSEATILISMGIQGDETMGTSDIVILDGKITILPLILMWAKCMLINIQAFTQFQLTAMITSIANAFISFARPHKTSAVDESLAYQLFQETWVNIGMGLIAALTFGKQSPSSVTLLRKPPGEEKNWQIINGFMFRNIFTQSVYQIAVVNMLQFNGFGFTDRAVDTTTFVVPIFLQVLNMISARKIEEKNIFSGIRPRFIWLIAALMVVPFVSVEILARMVVLERLDGKQWAVCVGIALVSWPVGFAAKFVPVRFFVTPFLLLVALVIAVVHRLKELGNWIKSSASKLEFWR